MKIQDHCARFGLAFSLSLFACGASAATINPGDLVVSELMANPAAVADSRGEWLELYNTSQTGLDLNGLVLRDNGSNLHTISAAGPLVIDPGAYFVLGRSGDSSTNGGYLADYVYSNFSLSNSGDDIVLEWDGQTVFSLAYGSENGFGQAGTSMALQQLSAAIGASDYLASTATYGDGDLGTPGTGELGGGTVSEVPLPAAGWLFCSSMGLLAGIKRRARH